MVAYWDPVQKTFTAPPPGTTGPASGALPQSNVTAGPQSPVLQPLPSGHGTFIDLQGGSQSYVVAHIHADGGASAECQGHSGEHP